MNGSNIALDTNEAIAVLNNPGDAGQWIAAFTAVTSQFPLSASCVSER